VKATKAEAAALGRARLAEICLARDGKTLIREGSEPEPNTGCWLWVRYVKPNGYGGLCFRGRNRYAHRVSYEAFRGPIPTGLHLDHLCRVRSCVNPDHLEAVTCRTNVLRGEGISAACARATSCSQGHEYTEANTYPWRDARYCRACRRASSVAEARRRRDIRRARRCAA
jgi:hypothetical protein